MTSYGVFGQLTLGELIQKLEEREPKAKVAIGFGAPHSDRGDYSEVAFTPAFDTTVESMLKHARSAVNASYDGYKGGTFQMTLETPVNVGLWGECGEPIGAFLLNVMLQSVPKITKTWRIRFEHTFNADTLQQAMGMAYERFSDYAEGWEIKNAN